MKYLIPLLMCTALLFAQGGGSVTVTGEGVDLGAAKQDAMRQAVEQVLGANLHGWGITENFKMVKDVIMTNTEGYISSAKLVSQKQLKDKWQAVMDITVSMVPLKQNALSLSQWLGGLRFLVVYDPRKVKTAEDTALYAYARERMVQYLNDQGYRCIENEVYEQFKDETFKMLGESDTSSMDYASKMGILVDAEFFVNVFNIIKQEDQKAMGMTAMKATIDTKGYDNCTAEQLGTVVGTGDATLGMDKDRLVTLRNAIDPAMKSAAEQYNYNVVKKLSEWCNNGAPYELRFYNVDKNHMKKLVDTLIAGGDYGSQLIPVQTRSFWRLNLTYKKTAYAMWHQIDDIAIALNWPLATPLQYARQIWFTPEGSSVPEADKIAAVKSAAGSGGNNKK